MTLFPADGHDHEVGVALDLGTERSGWCTVIGDTIRGADVIAAKRVPPAKRDRSTAAAQTAGEYALVCEMIAAVQHRLTTLKPAWVASENIYLAEYESKDLRKRRKTNAHTHEVLAGLKIAVISWCYNNSTPIYLGSTAEIDSACNIPLRLRRTGRKEQTMAFAKRLGWTVPQDAADSICVAFWAKGQRRLDLIVEGASRDSQ